MKRGPSVAGVRELPFFELVEWMRLRPNRFVNVLAIVLVGVGGGASLGLGSGFGIGSSDPLCEDELAIGGGLFVLYDGSRAVCSTNGTGGSGMLESSEGYDRGGLDSGLDRSLS